MLDYKKLDQELNSYKTPLYADPVAHGVGSVNEKISDVEAVLDRVVAIAMQSVENHEYCEDRYKTASNDYQDALENLLVNDADVMQQKSQGLRVSVANSKIPVKLKTMRDAELDFRKAKSFKERAFLSFDRWNNKAKNINLQLNTINTQIKIGEVTEDTIRKALEGRAIKLKKKEE